jgi:hypothetical protein
MNRRQKYGTPGGGMSKEQLQRTIDLSALGVSPEVAETFRLEEQRVAKAMRDLPGPGGTGAPGTKDGTSSVAADSLSVVEKQLSDRSNQVHYYIRAIQMESLLEQDLEADLKVMRDEVGSAVKDEKFGQSKAASVRLRLERQLGIIKKRCDAVRIWDRATVHTRQCLPLSSVSQIDCLVSYRRPYAAYCQGFGDRFRQRQRAP